MSRAADLDEVKQRVRTLLDECVGGGLGGYDALRAALDEEIAHRQLADLAEDEREGLYGGSFGAAQADKSRREFQASLADAQARMGVALQRIERYKARVRSQ
ncbi:hypothetical protein [Streptomyces sp. MAA16]|uniref:hypothetical protein n=1 Tax=Streptomyces sp. MAA16 TaxID=3035116 RepID=UPI00247605E3|nr:hypothetical protein [Streptomyces sp. MAA16]MDH6701432.1 hypothetical protein [Streptomyces sp. MAA16]